MRFRHRFEPDRPRNAASARVHAAGRLERLLADGAVELLCRIPHRDDEFVLPRLNEVRDVVRERDLPALVRHPGLDSVDEHLRAEVDLLEVEDEPLARPGGGRERTAVPERLRRLQFAPHAGKRALNRKRNENLPLPVLRPLVSLACHGVLPQSVQVRPLVADHLGARVQPPGVLRSNLLAPWCLDGDWCLRIVGEGGGARKEASRRQHFPKKCCPHAAIIQNRRRSINIPISVSTTAWPT